MQVIKYFSSLRVSRLTLFFALFIVISASFMRQVVDFVRSYIGKEAVSSIYGVIVILAGILFLYLLFRGRSRVLRIIPAVVLVIIGVYFALQIKIPAERIHIAEYGILGWLAMRDLGRMNKKAKAAFFAFMFAAIIGSLDEAFQAVLPYRYYDTRDIVFNALGGIWGVLLYLFR